MTMFLLFASLVDANESAWGASANERQQRRQTPLLRNQSEDREEEVGRADMTSQVHVNSSFSRQWRSVLIGVKVATSQRLIEPLLSA